jgi:hypothetical protein
MLRPAQPAEPTLKDFFSKAHCGIILDIQLGENDIGKYISGRPTQNNLKQWANYAKKNSFDPSDSRKQSKRDLDCYSNTPENDPEYTIPDEAMEGDGGSFKHYSQVSRNSYTGKRGSKRGK